MSDIKELINGFNAENSRNIDDELLKYGKNLKEFQLLENLDKEYEEAKNELKETHKKLQEIENAILSVNKEKKEREERAEKLYQEGKSLFEKGKYKDAKEKWLHCIELIPNHRRAEAAIKEADEIIKDEEEKAKKIEQKIEIIEKCLIEKDYEKALIIAESTLKIDEHNQKVIDLKQEILKIIREEKEAQEKRKKEEEEKKKIISEIVASASALQAQKKYEEAVNEYKRALSHDPDNELIKEKLQICIEDLKRFIEEKERERKELEEKNRKITELQVKASRLTRERDYDEAVKVYEEILMIDPSREDIYGEIKKLNEKIEALKIEKEKREKEAKEKLLRLEEEKRRREEERKRREEEEKRIRDEKLKSHYGRGLKYFKMMEYEKALSEWEVVVSIDPKFENVVSLIDEAGRKLNEIKVKEEEERKKIQEEQRRIEEEKERERRQVEKKVQELFLEGMQLVSVYRYEEALEKLSEALSYKRDDEGIRKEIAEIKRILEEKRKERLREEKEKEEKEKQRKAKIEKIKFLFEQAQMYFEEQDYQRAIEELNKILEIDFSNSEARAWLFKAERAMKEAEQKMKEEREKIEKRNEIISKLNFEATELFNDEKYEEAVRIWEKVFEMDPMHTESKQGIIRAKQRIKEREHREKIRTLVWKLLKEKENQFYYLKKSVEKGERFYKEGEYKQALAEWEKALIELNS